MTNPTAIPFAAYKGNEPYIFISYSHRDSATVFPILKEFRDAGFRVWYDEGIDPGNEWPEEVAHALESCSLFVVFISPNSVASVNVRNEINFALSTDVAFIGIHTVETNLTAGLRLQIGAKQAIMRYRMEPAAFIQKCALSFDQVGISRDPAARASRGLPVPTPAPEPPPPAPWRPSGRAVITLTDGSEHISPVNCLLTRSWRFVYDGIAPNYNPRVPEVTLFSDLVSLRQRREADDLTGPTTIVLTDLDGQTSTMQANLDGVAFIYADGANRAECPFNDVETIAFDPDGAAEADPTLVRVTTRDGESTYCPTGLFLVGTSERPGPGESGGSGLTWTTTFVTDRGRRLRQSGLRSIRFRKVELTGSFEDIWIALCQVEFTLADGRVMPARLAMDRLKFFGVDEFGPLQFPVEDIALIEFGILPEPIPEAPGEPVAGPADQPADDAPPPLPDPTDLPEQPADDADSPASDDVAPDAESSPRAESALATAPAADPAPAPTAEGSPVVDPAPTADPASVAEGPPRPRRRESGSGVDPYANHYANMANGGMAAATADEVYFCGSDGLYRMDSNGSDRQRLATGQISHVCVVGGWIYYRLTSVPGRLPGTPGTEPGVWRIRPDGSQATRVVEGWITSYLTDGEDVLFLDPAAPGIHGAVIGVAGRGIQLDEPCSAFTVVERWILFTSSTGRALRRVSLEAGGEQITLDENPATRINTMEGQVYVVARLGQGMFRLNPDGSERTRIGQDLTDYMVADDGWVYYTNTADGSSLHRIRPDGSQPTKLGSDRTSNFAIAEGWIYYRNTDDSFRACRLSLDGATRQTLE